MKTYFNKMLSLIVAASLLVSFSVISFAVPEGVEYTIANPYDTVDWSTWKAYKGNLHCHTLASDGSTDFAEMIEYHYSLGYDYLSITDHGVMSTSWTDVNTVPYMSLLGKFETGSITYMPTPLTPERYTEITTPGEDGRAMIQIPNGIELNPTSFNSSHVNSWFGTYGNGVIGGTSDYETAIKGAHEGGGLSVINHPGEYTGEKEQDDPELAYSDDYHVNKFTNLLLKYDSCIGIDVNSKGDGRTRNDRKLWDRLLQNCIPNGRNVFAIGTSDAHSISAVDTAWTINMLPELTADSVRESLETGTFFAGSRCLKNSKELSEISMATGLDLGTDWRADSGIIQPEVTEITVNDEENTITIEADNALVIRWIANGNLIAYGNTIDLDMYLGQIDSYVRAEVFGEGGILYTQPFILEYDSSPEADIGLFYDFGNLIALFRSNVFKILANTPGFSIVWKALTGNETQN
ncbi:MAG: hypothetical protein BWY46_00097 [Firmicutes bacterium ADurb.Bin300]|nr:MAG: hypothetical protein BWY46_00097 [Firmicutes bacterium ADurb.Bin300]